MDAFLVFQNLRSAWKSALALLALRSLPEKSSFSNVDLRTQAIVISHRETAASTRGLFFAVSFRSAKFRRKVPLSTIAEC